MVCHPRLNSSGDITFSAVNKSSCILARNYLTNKVSRKSHTQEQQIHVPKHSRHTYTHYTIKRTYTHIRACTQTLSRTETNSRSKILGKRTVKTIHKSKGGKKRTVLKRFSKTPFKDVLTLIFPHVTQDL